VLSGCQTLPSLPNPFQRTVSVAEPESAPATRRQQSVIQDFEREIANQLLASAPTWQEVSSQDERQAYVSAANRIINQSGLNLALLTSRQIRALDALKALLFEGEHQLSRWVELNHLKYIHQISANPDPALIQTLGDNLNQQIAAGVSYPQPFIDAALVISSEHPTLSNIIQRLSTDEQLWAKNRIKGHIDGPTPVTQIQDSSNVLLSALRDTESLYENPYYDIRREVQPEQLALDLIALSLEEGLTFFSQSDDISISGFEHESPFLSLVSGQVVELNLPQLLTLPAFEYQTIAFLAATQLSSDASWPPVWRASLAHAVGIRLTSDSVPTHETEVGRQLKQLMTYKLAIAELELASGSATFEQIKIDLLANSPYSEAQLDQLLLNWIASDASMALSAKILQEIRSVRREDLKQILEMPAPTNFAEFKSQLAQQLAK
jgi:hypothetical protein